MSHDPAEPEARLSPESVLAAHARGDVSPDRLHEEHLRPDQIGWLNEFRTVTAATAIAECIVNGAADC